MDERTRRSRSRKATSTPRRGKRRVSWLAPPPIVGAQSLKPVPSLRPRSRVANGRSLPALSRDSQFIQGIFQPGPPRPRKQPVPTPPPQEHSLSPRGPQQPAIQLTAQPVPINGSRRFDPPDGGFHPGRQFLPSTRPQGSQVCPLVGTNRMLRACPRPGGPLGQDIRPGTLPTHPACPQLTTDPPPTPCRKPPPRETGPLSIWSAPWSGGCTPTFRGSNPW